MRAGLSSTPEHPHRRHRAHSCAASSRLSRDTLRSSRASTNPNSPLALGDRANRHEDGVCGHQKAGGEGGPDRLPQGGHRLDDTSLSFVSTLAFRPPCVLRIGMPRVLADVRARFRFHALYQQPHHASPLNLLTRVSPDSASLSGTMAFAKYVFKKSAQYETDLYTTNAKPPPVCVGPVPEAVRRMYVVVRVLLCV